MHANRPSVAWLTAAVAMSLGAVPRMDAQESDVYHPTIQFGTGLINIPVAWVAPRSGELFISASGKTIPSYAQSGRQGFASLWNTNAAVETHWLGRISVGASAYSQNPEWGFFGQLLLLRDNEYAYLPGVAVGLRNVGKYTHEERLLIGTDICLDTLTNTYHECATFGRTFKTAPSVYGVATKQIALASPMSGIPSSTLSLSVGYGDGLFSDDGGLGATYNRRGQLAKGLFFGTRLNFHPTANTVLSLLAENDGWDWNAGLVADWRGLSLGVYGTELEEGTTRRPEDFRIYNYTKINVTLGYNGNVFDVARGVLLRARITELEREQARLRAEIASRERRIRALELALQKAQASELADLARRRQELESELQQEREAVRAANERLRDLQQGRQPVAPTTPPQTTPPPTTPPPSGSTTPPS